MKKLNLKPTHKPIQYYYEALEQYDQHNITHEGAVSTPFAFLLAACAKKVGVTLEPQHAMRSPKGDRIVIDGAIIDPYRLPIVYWEAEEKTAVFKVLDAPKRQPNGAKGVMET